MESPIERTSVPPERKRRRIPTGRVLIGAIVAALVLALVGRHLYYRSKINAELDAIRKAGYPVTLQELSDYYPVPKGDNAAKIYSAAFTYYKDGPDDLPLVGDGKSKLPPRGEPLPKEMQTAISAYLASNAHALDLLHKAATVEGCRYDVNLLDGNALLPHLAPLRQAERLLELQALMKVEEGEPDEAASATAASFAAAYSLQNEPLLISQLVRFSMNTMALGTLERVLCRMTLTDKQLMDISMRIVQEDSPKPFLRGMAGQRCDWEYLFESEKWEEASGEDTTSPKLNAISSLFYRLSDMLFQDHITYLKLMSECVSAASGTPKEMREMRASLPLEIAQAAKSCRLVPMLFASAPRSFEDELTLIARLRAARAGIAVERFRVANGRLPDSLDELVPKWLDAVPSDPWDDQPIRYRKLTKGFVTYSVGPDLKDDSGKERDPLHVNAPYDITFIVAR